jgi:hypothetical protein
MHTFYAELIDGLGQVQACIIDTIIQIPTHKSTSWPKFCELKIVDTRGENALEVLEGMENLKNGSTQIFIRGPINRPNSSFLGQNFCEDPDRKSPQQI